MNRITRGPVLSRVIQDHIKHYITENRLAPGDPLPPLSQLAQDFGVSVGSLREAVRALESLGILEVAHGNGVYVRAFNFDSVLDLLSYGFVFSPATISQILQIRKWLEMAAVSEVVQSITEADLAEMDEILRRWEVKARAGAPIIEEDRAFHIALNRATHNSSLVALLDVFWVVYHAVHARYADKPVQAPSPLAVVERHRAILSAVRSGQVSVARQIIEEDLRGAEDWARKMGQLDALEPTLNPATPAALG